MLPKACKCPVLQQFVGVRAACRRRSSRRIGAVVTVVGFRGLRLGRTSCWLTRCSLHYFVYFCNIYLRCRHLSRNEGFCTCGKRRVPSLKQHRGRIFQHFQPTQNVAHFCLRDSPPFTGPMYLYTVPPLCPEGSCPPAPTHLVCLPRGRSRRDPRPLDAALDSNGCHVRTSKPT